jgi:ATP-dependent DNA helicase RecG
MSFRQICSKPYARFLIEIKAYSGNDHIEFIEHDIFITNVPLDNVLNDGNNIEELNIPDKGLERVQNELQNELNVKEKNILLLIKQNSKITQKEISEVIGITPQNIRKHIAKLKQKGKLLRIGPNKGGYWKVNS